MNQYPEHEKLQAVKDQSQAIGDFIENGPYTIGEWYHYSFDDDGMDTPEPDCGDGCTRMYHRTMLIPVRKRINQVLAEWFEIDEDVLELEKRRMLESLRTE